MRVDFSVAGAGNYLRGYYADAPLGSEAQESLTKSGATRIPAFVTDSGKPWLFTPDVGGVYTFQIEQISKGAASYGGGYENAPDGFLTETVESTSTVALYVGQKVTQRIGFGADTATLTLFVIGDSIQQSSFDLHGFTSPIIEEPKTSKAETSALNTTVVAAVAALVGELASVAIGDLAAVFDDLIGAFQGHLIETGIHLNDDTDNTPQIFDLTPDSPVGLRQAMVRLLTLLDQHMRNDNNNGTPVALPGWAASGTGSGYFHENNRVDWKNALLSTSAGDQLDTFIALADAWRAYTAHRLDDNVHANADVVNVAAALPALLNLHALFLSGIQAQSPTAPPSVNTGVTALVHSAGFEEA